MPRNKKEGIIFGAIICVIMVYFMGLLNISIHMGGLNSTVLLISMKALPLTFLIAFVLETILVGPCNHQLLKHFVGEGDSKNSFILFNCFFIVTMMSVLMTIIGGVIGGDSLSTVLSEFFIRWPRNFCAAFFLNILVAGPVSRSVLRQIQK